MTNVLYIDCNNSGIAGDMFLAAIYGLNEDDSILQKIQTYVNDNIKNAKLTQISINKISRNGMFPNHLNLKYTESKPELHVQQIQEHIPKLCSFLTLSQEALQFASQWFQILLDAERSIHSSMEPDNIHLHELGSVDTLIDICGGTAYLDALGLFLPENGLKIICSDIAVGGGMVKIDHGTIPVPAPATTKIIKKYSIPIRGGPIEKELLTPTGAGLIGNLKKFENLQFSEHIPPMTVSNIGLSTGKLGDETFPNILRLFLGTKSSPTLESGYDVVVLETMVDDSTGETLGITMDLLFQEGALDVNFISVQGKKNRPGVLIRVLSSKDQVDRLMKVLFTNLGTLGVRYRTEKRLCLKREIIEKTTNIDNVSVSFHVKVAYNPSKPNEILFFKVEHDDLIQISEKLKKPLAITRIILESEFLKHN
jgi:pyridinium-3,5-bisthiocarboxylic acid mononucleotide nickel chelatase